MNGKDVRERAKRIGWRGLNMYNKDIRRLIDMVNSLADDRDAKQARIDDAAAILHAFRTDALVNESLRPPTIGQRIPSVGYELALKKLEPGKTLPTLEQIAAGEKKQ
jgi:hypothetical protein